MPKQGSSTIMFRYTAPLVSVVRVARLPRSSACPTAERPSGCDLGYNALLNRIALTDHRLRHGGDAFPSPPSRWTTSIGKVTYSRKGELWPTAIRLGI